LVVTTICSGGSDARPDPIPKNLNGAVMRVWSQTLDVNPWAFKVWQAMLWLDQGPKGCHISPDNLPSRGSLPVVSLWSRVLRFIMLS
jgi:hypothetical protein